GRRGTVRDALRLVVGKELYAPFPSAAEFGELFSSALPTTVQQLAGGVVVGHRGAEPQRQHGRLAGGDPYDVVVLAGQPGERAVLGDLVGGQVGQVAHRHVRDDQREAFRADATQPVTGAVELGEVEVGAIGDGVGVQAAFQAGGRARPVGRGRFVPGRPVR